MKVIYLIAAFSLGCINPLKAQTPSDSVYIYKSFLGYKFIQHEERLNFNQLPDVLDENQEAFLLIKKAKTNNIVSSIIGGIGGFMIGWQLGTAIVGGEPNWTLAAVGGGLVVVSIPIYSKSMGQTLRAVDLYNAGLGTNSRRPKLNLRFVRHGFGFALDF